MVVELNPTAIALLRADLDEARFSEASLDGLWGPDAAAALRRNERVPALRALAALRARLGAPTAVATLAELFV
ncbi:MAG TPA: SAM-dependent methyltransferase, partial [Microterricola sp.]